MNKIKYYNEFVSEKLLLEKQLTTKLYHGGSALFNKFDLSFLSPKSGQTTYGYGIYLTDSYSLANIYATEENEFKDGYIYTVNVELRDYLEFNKFPSKSVLNRIQKQLDKENIDIDLSNPINHSFNAKYDDPDEKYITLSNTWNLISYLVNYFYDTASTDDKFKIGMFGFKKIVSELLVRCGIDGLKYRLNNTSKMAIEYGHSGYGYVIYNDETITIENVEKVK